MVKEGTVWTGNVTPVHSSSSRFTYVGTWSKIVDIGSVGGSYQTSNTNNNTIAFTYAGANLWLYFRRSQTSGKVGVTVDGGTETLYDLYPPSGTADYKTLSQILAQAIHTIKIRVTNQQNIASKGFDVNFVAAAYELFAGSQQAFSFQEETLNVVTLTPTAAAPNDATYVIVTSNINLPNAQLASNLGSDIGPSTDATYKLGPTPGKGWLWLYLSALNADPAGLFNGLFWYRSDLGKLSYQRGAVVDRIVAEALAQTLTNKTFGDAPTFSTMTAGSVLFAGIGGLLSQDNANLNWNSVTKKAGFGTATPGATVHAARSDGDYQFKLERSGSVDPRVYGIAVAGVAGNPYFTLDDITANASRMAILPSGVVGFGIVPSVLTYRMHLAGSAPGVVDGKRLAIENSIGGTTDAFRYFADIVFRSASDTLGTVGESWQMGQDLLGSGTRKFQIRDIAVTGSPVRVTIDKLGNISVGTADPVVSLDVSGGGSPRIHVAGTGAASVPALQGAYYDWNDLTGSTGETDFINNQGGGTGGFAWFNTPSAGTPMTLLASLLPASGLSVKGQIESTATGYKFPDGTTQATSAFLAATQYSSLAASFSTSSTTDVSTGVGVSLVAPSSGKVRAWMTTEFQHNTAGNFIVYSIYRNTTGIPTQGSAATGTGLAHNTQTAGGAGGNNFYSVPVLFLDSGLTAGTTYYYYQAVHTNGGIATLQGGSGQTGIMAQPA